MSDQVRFARLPFWQGWGEPMRAEVRIRDLEVIDGTVPTDLTGSLYRVGPETQYPPLDTGPEIYFNGEGMIHQFRFDAGHVDYQSRYVRNERFLAQEQARRSLFGRYRNRYTNDPAAAGVNPTTANTHVVWHGGRLLVLKEDGLPIEVDPLTLDTREDWNGDGKVTAQWLSAHPKIDTATDELRTFAYQAAGDASLDMAYYAVRHSGAVAHDAWFEAPYACNVHDFAIAGDYVVFPFYPLITDLEVVKHGGPFYQWHRDQQAHFAVMPNDGSASDIRWFHGPPFFAAHIMNAFTDGTMVHLDLDAQRAGWPMFPNADGAPHAASDGVAHLSRLTLDLDGPDRYQLTPLTEPEVTAGMSRSDDRFQGVPYRHGYFLSHPPGELAGPRRFVSHIDHVTKTVKSFDPGPDNSAQEPCFVPANRNSPEGHGYVMVCVNRTAEHRTDLVILDAMALDGPPVAVIRIPVRVRMTFHGSWVSDEAYETKTAAFRPAA